MRERAQGAARAGAAADGNAAAPASGAPASGATARAPAPAARAPARTAAARTALGRGIHRLVLRFRLNRAASWASTGLFYGLAAGLVAAALSGTVRLPLPGLALAGLAAALGTLSGAAVSLGRRADTRRILVSADSSLGTRELVSTAWELSGSAPAGTFSEAVIADAEAVLARTPPGRILGAPRMPLLPFAPILIALITAALIFPFDLGSLLRAREQGRDQLASIGEDLESAGRSLLESARARDQGRVLALSRELAQLGRDLADHRIQNEEAMDRMQDLERRMATEYDLQLRELPQETPSGRAGSGPAGQGAEGAPDTEGTARPGGPPAGAGRDSDRELRDMGKALDSLRNGQRRAAPRGRGGSGTGQPPSMADRPEGNPPSGSGGLPPGGGGGRRQGTDPGKEPGGGSPGLGSNGNNPEGDQESSVPGSTPAPDTRGPASPIIRADQGPGLKAGTTPGPGDSTKALVRALPDSTGSRAREDRTLRRYAQEAESAIARDEVPLKLKQYVKDYFTTLGMSAGGGK